MLFRPQPQAFQPLRFDPATPYPIVPQPGAQTNEPWFGYTTSEEGQTRGPISLARTQAPEMEQPTQPDFAPTPPPKTEPPAMSTTPQRPRMLPRVDMATAMAVAADKARTGKSLDELYRERGYDTSGSDEGFVSNLRMRAKQGDAGAWQKLAFLSPGETPEALLTGTKREREARMLRFAQDQARMTAQREAEANKAARAERAAELQAGRQHQVTLSKMQIDANERAQQAQANYNNKKLAIEEMAMRGQIDAARAAQEIAKAQNERNAAFQEAQLGMQREGLSFEKEKFRAQPQQRDPLEAAAIGEALTQTREEGGDVWAKFNQLSGKPGAVQNAQAPIEASPMAVAKRMQQLGIPDTKTAYKEALEKVMTSEGIEPSGLNIMFGKADINERPLFREYSPINNVEYKKQVVENVMKQLQFKGFTPEQAARIVAEYTTSNRVM